MRASDVTSHSLALLSLRWNQLLQQVQGTKNPPITVVTGFAGPAAPTFPIRSCGFGGRAARTRRLTNVDA